ncbi:MAG: hypothetical protein HYX52_04025 [Chloroflexi bacterium]|nr:hypothetical protein [Chloroflexota bacterium]
MDTLLPWLVRFAHIGSAIVWVGAYAFLSMVMLPRVARAAEAPTLTIQAVANGAGRLVNGSGIATVVFGAILIFLTRGPALFSSGRMGEWGGLLAGSVILALAMLYLGFGPLRLLSDARTMTVEQARRAGRLSMMGAVAGFIVLAMMTRMLYAA